MDYLIELLGGQFGLSPAELFGILALVSMICRLVGKAIPDDKLGVLGLIRKGCKILGLYVSNRLESGITTNDVAKSVIYNVR